MVEFMRVYCFCTLMLCLFERCRSTDRKDYSVYTLESNHQTLEKVARQASSDRVCHCQVQALCDTIKEQYIKEVFAFSFARTPPVSPYYPWERLTTLAWDVRPGTMCMAHKHGVRVVMNAGDVASAMTSQVARKSWVQLQLREALLAFADGINFDLESAIQPGSELATQYTLLVAETAAAFHRFIPGSQVSVDIPWSPFDVDGRNYDWKGLAEAADLLFVMAYDMQSQMFGRCVASPNSPEPLVRRGLQQWLGLGMPPSKLVLGLPWYGYDYPCQPDAAGVPPSPTTDVCVLEPVPFRGAACSDAAGPERDYMELMQILHDGRNTTDVRWEAAQKAPYFNYVDRDGTVHQVWLDNPQSLAMKVAAAVENGLRGVGMWNIDCLDYTSTNAQIVNETKAMWDAFEPFFR